jgi:hypothetical protein
VRVTSAFGGTSEGEFHTRLNATRCYSDCSTKASTAPSVFNSPGLEIIGTHLALTLERGNLLDGDELVYAPLGFFMVATVAHAARAQEHTFYVETTVVVQRLESPAARHDHRDEIPRDGDLRGIRPPLRVGGLFEPNLAGSGGRQPSPASKQLLIGANGRGWLWGAGLRVGVCGFVRGGRHLAHRTVGTSLRMSPTTFDLRRNNLVRRTSGSENLGSEP